MFGRDPKHRLHDVEVDEDVTEERLQVFLEERGQAFKRVMPLAMINLAIAQ